MSTHKAAATAHKPNRAFIYTPPPTRQMQRECSIPKLNALPPPSSAAQEPGGKEEAPDRANNDFSVQYAAAAPSESHF